MFLLLQNDPFPSTETNQTSLERRPFTFKVATVGQVEVRSVHVVGSYAILHTGPLNLWHCDTWFTSWKFMNIVTVPVWQTDIWEMYSTFSFNLQRLTSGGNRPTLALYKIDCPLSHWNDASPAPQQGFASTEDSGRKMQSRPAKSWTSNTMWQDAASANQKYVRPQSWWITLLHERHPPAVNLVICGTVKTLQSCEVLCLL